MGMTDSAFSGPKGVPPLEYCWSFAIRTLAAAAGVKATPSLRKEDCGVAPLGTSDRSLRVAGDRKFLTPRGRERHLAVLNFANSVFNYNSSTLRATEA
jgi:hypothetical protein